MVPLSLLTKSTLLRFLRIQRLWTALEGMMLKVKLQYFGHLMRRVDSLEKTSCWEGLGAGGEGDDIG